MRYLIVVVSYLFQYCIEFNFRATDKCSILKINFILNEAPTKGDKLVTTTARCDDVNFRLINSLIVRSLVRAHARLSTGGGHRKSDQILYLITVFGPMVCVRYGSVTRYVPLEVYRL